jgi:hypothetical protein
MLQLSDHNNDSSRGLSSKASTTGEIGPEGKATGPTSTIVRTLASQNQMLTEMVNSVSIAKL